MSDNGTNCGLPPPLSVNCTWCSKLRLHCYAEIAKRCYQVSITKIRSQRSMKRVPRHLCAFLQQNGRLGGVNEC
jgi:hypothetical protein